MIQCTVQVLILERTIVYLLNINFRRTLTLIQQPDLNQTLVNPTGWDDIGGKV